MSDKVVPIRPPAFPGEIPITEQTANELAQAVHILLKHFGMVNTLAAVNEAILAMGYTELARGNPKDHQRCFQASIGITKTLVDLLETADDPADH